jgi:hypothetical protein
MNEVKGFVLLLSKRLQPVSSSGMFPFVLEGGDIPGFVCHNLSEREAIGGILKTPGFGFVGSRPPIEELHLKKHLFIKCLPIMNNS